MAPFVIAFVFPETDDNLKVGRLVQTAKQVFAGMEGMEDVKIHAARQDAAETIISFLDTGEDPDEGNLVAHARRELALIGNDRDFDESIIGAVKSFSSYGHSGGSASVAVPLLNDLLQYKNISPLTDDPDEWMFISEEVAGVEPGIWQSVRNREAFSSNGGQTYYLVSDEERVIHKSKKRRVPSKDDEGEG